MIPTAITYQKEDEQQFERDIRQFEKEQKIEDQTLTKLEC